MVTFGLTLQSYMRGETPLSREAVEYVLADDHAAALATEKRKVEDLANTIERLMLRAELRHDGLYHIRLSAEGYLYSEEEFSHWCPITPPREEE